MTVRSLQHVALAVPDPAVGRKFYQEFGLEAREEGRRIIMRCHGRDQDQMVLLEAPSRKLHHLCFGTRADLLPGLKRRIEDGSVRLLDPPREHPADGLWLRDPDGVLINVRAVEPAPPLGGPEWRINTPGHYTRLGARGCPPRDTSVRPRRLGHTLRFTPDINPQIDFYTRVLGLRLSDRARDIVAFLHCEGGSDHHVLAFLKSDRPGYHHASFEVANIDEIGFGASRLLDKGYGYGWGMGRHVLGSNFFFYIRDPWHGLAEYFCDIDYIPAEVKWEAQDWPPQDALYAWGPNVPEDFGKNFELGG